MKKLLIIFLLNTAFNPISFSQVEKNHNLIIKEIKVECEKINTILIGFQKSDEKMIENIRVTEIEIDKYKSENHPGVGERNSKTTLYYLVVNYEEYDGDDRLIKIEYINNVSEYSNYLEYYFNKENQLIFYYGKFSGENNEERMYFNDDKLIEIRQKYYDGNEKVREEKFKSDNLTKNHYLKASEIKAELKKQCWY